MGVVYLARQREPIARLVALKLLRTDRDADRLMARFEAERRALARLNHPNVAHVYDTGTAEDGSPWIAMEHVPGEPITAFCDGRNATIGERIDVFIGVCEGVQHVHQKGLIHRDLKPPNILVTDSDGRWIAKIIDFGIAKGFGDPLTAETLTHGQLVGTPLYIAPEALRGEEQDTRVDVYALGLVLFRLLVGAKPVPPEGSTNFLDMVRALSQGEAIPTPATRFSQLPPDQRRRVSRARRSEPDKLARLFSQDLDWIIMKAIQADPDKRYSTADALAADLQRYLDGQPVAARPPSLAYVATKAVRRHRWIALGASVAVLSMVVGTISTAYQARLAQREAQRADDAARDAEERRIEAEQVSAMLNEMFAAANPYEQGDDPSVRALLDRGAEMISARELPGKVRAQLLLSIGDAYVGLGELDTATGAASQAVELLEADPGRNQRALAVAVTQLADRHLRARRDAEAFAEATRALELFDQTDAAPHDRSNPLHLLAVLRQHEGDLVGATKLAKDALAAEDTRPGNDQRLALQILNTLTNIANMNGDYKAARGHVEEALGRVENDRKSLTPVHLMMTLAMVQAGEGDVDLALATMHEALAAATDRAGPDHMLSRTLRLNIGGVNHRSGHHEEAERIFEAELAAGWMEWNQRAMALNHLGDIAQNKGDHVAAEAYCRRVLDNATEIDPLTVATAHLQMSGAIAAQDRMKEANATFALGIGMATEIFGPAHKTVQRAKLQYGDILAIHDLYPDAAALFSEVATERADTLGEDHPETVFVRIRAGHSSAAAGLDDAAERHLRLAIHNLENAAPADQKAALTALAEVLERSDRAEEAVDLRARAAEIPTEPSE